MAERDDEIAELRQRIIQLEDRPAAPDLEWLQTSDVWKRAQFAASPKWLKANVIFVGLILSFFVGSIIYSFIDYYLLKK